jgi:hypothetical protein
VAAACLFGGCAAAGAAKSVSPSAVVVGVVGESGGVNVLHADFRTADGRTPAYPSGMPRPVMIALPHIASFASSRAALERGPLGHLKPGVLYGVAGTRLLVVNAGSGPYDAAQADAVHATGVADALTGTRYGTDPNALVVVVLTNGNELASYHWLAQQSWVDIASTSDYEISTTADPTQCAGAADVRAWTAAGHQLFSSAGNTTDQPEPLVSPNGLPETYVVGGVTAQGKTWTPGQTTETDPFYEFGNVVRPYETGELYSFKAAAPDSPTGTQHFGGTSGATPRTAGWAATLIAHARAALRQTGPVRGALAAGPHRPLRGPLRDGRFTRTELTTLLHEVAMPHSGLPDGAQYAAEGFGALNASAIARAMRILDGTVSQPTRPGDEQADALAHQARAVLLDRC